MMYNSEFPYCSPGLLSTLHARGRRLLPTLLGMSALLLLQSCSLLLDFDECATDSDCAGAGVCTEGICKPPPTEAVINIIAEDTTWTADKVYLLKDVITITSPAVLTIEPGTKVLAEKGAALVALPGARIEAVGTRQAPIVFSSAEPVGRRRAGDWGGVALIGKAKVSREDFNLRINADEQQPIVGGTDDNWNCGTIKYTRIEFGGGFVEGDNALNGLTLAGCGKETTVDYVHIHKGDDDNLEIFGGSVDIRHILLTRAGDDPFDIDTGWHGTAQFLAIQQDPVGNNSLEIGGLKEDHTAEPLTDIKIYNYTLIGGQGGGDIQRGAHIKEGARAFMSHGIIMGHHTVGVEVSDEASIQGARDGHTVVQHTLFYEVGLNGDSYFHAGASVPADPGSGDAGLDAGSEDAGGTDADTNSDPGGSEEGEYFDQVAYFTQPGFNNIFGEDPGIERPFDLTNPSWVPSATHTTGAAITPPPVAEGFDPTGVYLGAFRPGEIPWTEGWTDYPLN
ncbi:hypothetical protein [Bradymonas sediminis]|nr:hypothetical protein [Bradymonas sediminis]